ncbi:MAG: hypothetical protein GXP49_07005 [Deltaproteobacteria bacterium]|nr:hypothetical protein [Deltaproteobacteria bacterium]
MDYSNKALLSALAICSFAFLGGTAVRADDYVVYADWDPPEVGGSVTGANGWVDSKGLMGPAGAQYVIFADSSSGWIYQVKTTGDPDRHPNNPDDPGPMAPRTFTLVSSHRMTNDGVSPNHHCAFYMSDTGIYYGSNDSGIHRWNFNWQYLGKVVSRASSSTESLAYNPVTKEWWAGGRNRTIYKWNGSSWVSKFTCPNLAGSHHDGMEVIGDSLFVSDMTSDLIYQYRLDPKSGDPIDSANNPYKQFRYSSAHDVEGLGYGPNNHIWIASGSSNVYEIGGGELQHEIDPEQCDGIDNDGNGLIDDGLTRSCTTACGSGTEHCDNGKWVGCTAQKPSPEQCNGKDDNCNGQIDDGLTRNCSTICGSGTEHCQMGAWVGCTAQQPKPEECNGKDDDCNGTIDENLTRTCATACGEGTEVCDNGTWVNCDAPKPQEEICDGLDNNCDGTIDEGCGCIEGSTRECGTDEGECESGTQTCNAQGQWGPCEGAIGPTEEICDTLDNNCDGQVDEGCDCLPGDTRACGEDEGACQAGIQICDESGHFGDCLGDVGPSREVCDCADNDCNGKVDDGDLCGEGSECFACRCTKPCSFGECANGLICENGYCVPPKCKTDQDCGKDRKCSNGRCFDSCDVTVCDPGYKCVLGNCVTTDCGLTGCKQGLVCLDGSCQPNPCYSVTCPEGQFCRHGQCFDSCAGIDCEEGMICVDGECIQDPCAACDPDKEICYSGKCYPKENDPCDLVSCPSGMTCNAGECIQDPCNEASCPRGEACKNGQCAYGDLDNDGTPDDQDPDVDGDGIPNEEDKCHEKDCSRDHDNDGIDDPYDPDDDNDGIPDGLDKGKNGEDLSRDHDNDGIDDDKDADDDNDGIEDSKDKGPNGEDYSQDTDNDGFPDAQDSDDDNDGIEDSKDKGPNGEDYSRDTDNDGINNAEDSDDDNDGIPDQDDPYPLKPDKEENDNPNNNGSKASTKSSGCSATGGMDAAWIAALMWGIVLLFEKKKRTEKN